MKTWLSGMSPVAAALASACSADGEAAVDVWVVEGVDDVVVIVVAGGALAVLELPQPVSSAAAPQMTNKPPMQRRAMPEIVAGFA